MTFSANPLRPQILVGNLFFLKYYLRQKPYGYSMTPSTKNSFFGQILWGSAFESTMSYFIVQSSTLQYNIVLYSTEQYLIVQYRTSKYRVVPHSTISYFIVLQSSPCSTISFFFRNITCVKNHMATVLRLVPKNYFSDRSYGGVFLKVQYRTLQ